MKAHASKLAAAVVIGAVSILFTSCFYMPGVGGANARAGLVLPRYIAANTTSLALIVGGPGMNTIYATYPVGTTSATLSVPSGAARTFTLLANTPSVTFQGVSTVDLQPGATTEVTLNPTLFATQILVPDYLNSRLVQISDMTGTGWTTLTNVAAPISPVAVDIDTQGRVYMANYNSPAIIRMDDISGANSIGLSSLTTITQTYTRALAMDRTHGLLYYTDSSSLWRIQVTPTLGTEEVINLGSAGVFLSSVKGIAVDSDGFVYIANHYTGPEILKINPNPAASPSVVASYSDSSTLVYPYDILVSGDNVYVSDVAASAPKIVRLSKNLAFVDSFSGPGSDPFLGPERFVAVLNKKITVVDQPHDQYGNQLSTNARLVSFGDMTGAGWTPYGSFGTGQSQFEFYNGYMY